jgi:photosystem II stability/assembly factor-like uncharacterized protein
MKKIYALALPLLVLPILGGCNQQEIQPPPPGGVYRSTNEGATFEQAVDLEELPGEYIARFPLRHIYRWPNNPNHIYIAAEERGIVFSANDGETWSVIPTPLTRTVDVVVLSEGVLVASGVDGIGQGFVVRSFDAGEEWETVFTVPIPTEEGGFQLFGPQPQVASVVLSLTQDPFNLDRVYAGSNLGTLFVGEQSAKAWRSLRAITADTLTPLAGREAQAIRRVIASPHRPGELLVITEGRELLRILDDQQITVEVPEAIDTPPPFGVTGRPREVFDAAFVPGFPDALFVGVKDGVVITRDGGETWVKLPAPLDSSQAFNTVEVTIDPTDTNKLFVAVNNVVYRSADGGSTWHTTPLGLPEHVVRDISINPLRPSNMLIVVRPVRS